jgi:hypothetical protein
MPAMQGAIADLAAITFDNFIERQELILARGGGAIELSPVRCPIRKLVRPDVERTS